MLGVRAEAALRGGDLLEGEAEGIYWSAGEGRGDGGMEGRAGDSTAQAARPQEEEESQRVQRSSRGLWPPTSPSFSARHLVSAVPAMERRSGRVRSQQSLDVPLLSPGDAVLLLWRARPSEMAKTISLVVHCSWQIQKKYRRHDMLVGQKFRLKIGTSAVPGADLWHSPVLHTGRECGDPRLGLAPKESISCKHSRGHL